MDDSAYNLSVQQGDARTTVRVRGRIDVQDAGRLLGELTGAVRGRAGDVALDLSAVDYFDSSGGALLLLLRKRLAGEGRSLQLVGSRPEIDRLLELVDSGVVDRQPVAHDDGTIGRRTATTVFDLLSGGRDVVMFTGEITLGLVDALRHPGKIRWRELLVEIQRAGSESLPIVALISFLMGLVTAFQALVQLKQFGADIYVANLVGLSMVRELGPLMTAIIAAGRSGAAYAAELGTMKVSEEIDALVTLGLDRTRFLITPRVIALVLMLPCLTVFADLIGMLGGMFVSDAWIDMPPNVYFRQTQLAVRAVDVASGLLKSVIFGGIIATVGCMRGLQASGGAESVGQVTTSAVVTALTLIIAADAVFTMIFNYWGL